MVSKSQIKTMLTQAMVMMTLKMMVINASELLTLFRKISRYYTRMLTSLIGGKLTITWNSTKSRSKRCSKKRLEKNKKYRKVRKKRSRRNKFNHQKKFKNQLKSWIKKYRNKTKQKPSANLNLKIMMIS